MKGIETMMQPWLYLHFPTLQLDAILQQREQNPALNPDSASSLTPLVVLDVKNNQICQLNQAAKDQGIALDMGLATAISLSADLVIVEYQPQQETARLHELAQWLYQVVADIALFEPDGLALRISGMLSLYHNFDNYWAQISKILAAQQVSYCQALGNTAVTARLLARHASKHSDHQVTPQINPKLTIPQATQRQLEQLPIDALELPAVQLEQLHRVGVHHLAQLWKIDSRELGRRFGLEVLNYLDQLKGRRQLALKMYRPTEHFVKYLELFHEINQSQVLLFPLKQMVQEMAAFLLKREWLITSLTLTLHHRDSQCHQDHTIEICSARGEYLAAQWMTLATLKIERCELAAPVVGITLKTGAPIDKHCTVNDLFDGTTSEMSPAQLISLLQAKVGQKHLFGIELLADHRPELAFTYTNPLSTSDKLPLTGSPSHRPTLLLCQPLPLREKYTILQGPERIRSAWWDPQPIYRDYFIARNNQGAICWLFNEPNGNWYLHGYFC